MSSIQKVPTGGYRVRFNHRGKQISRTFPTKKNATDWQKVLDAMGAEYALAVVNSPVTSPLTLAEHLESHISRLTGVTEGTRKSARAHVKNHMGDIGAIPLTLFNREAVSSWINRLAKEGLSGKSIKNIHGLLSSAMKSAIADKLITENPCHGMRLPRTDHLDGEKIFLSREEFAKLYDLIPAWYQPLVITLVGTGMRFGEATALTVGDIDLEARSARIRQAWKMTGLAKKELGAPKSRKSNRTVALPEPVIEALLSIIEQKSSEDYLFTTPTNKVIGQGFFWKHVWSIAVQEFAGDNVRIDHDERGRKVRVVTKKGKRKHPRVHDLRHTFASWAISANVPLPTIQRQLGHESITTTIDTYGHLARADFDALGGAIANSLPARRLAIASASIDSLES